MNTKEKLYQIEDGPSRDRLIDAFKYAYDKRGRIEIHFDVAIGYTGLREDPKTVYISADMDRLRILRLEHEDGSGRSFNIYGTCRANLTRLDGFATKMDMETYRFVAYYNAANRKGTIRFSEA